MTHELSPLKLVLLGLVVASVLIAAFLLRPKTDQPVLLTNPSTIRYLPLGDSYTIGQSVHEADRWPNQLVARLTARGTSIQIVDNPSVTGYTSQNLIDKELPLLPKLKPDFVTVLIGVNDYVQGVDANTFQQRLNYIISSLKKQLAKPQNIVLVTIPDYGKTPSGALFGSPESSEAGIKKFNAIITAAGLQHNIPVADIFPISQQVANDPSLIASDGLHPSGKEYTAWTDIIYQTLTDNHLPL